MTNIHPGEVLEKLMEKNKVTPLEVMTKSGITEQDLYGILSRKSVVNPLTALILADSFSELSAREWLELQINFNKNIERF